ASSNGNGGGNESSGSSGGAIDAPDGSSAPPCPANPPWPGNPCAKLGQECDYSGPGGGYCGNVTAICVVQGYWQSAGQSCPSAPCPSAFPSSGETCSQSGLRCTYPLDALTCDSGVCGSGLTCGTLSCQNDAGATCDTWQCDCSGSSFSCTPGDCQGGNNDCPGCGGTWSAGCECPCTPPPTGELCGAAEACNFGNGTTADCLNGRFECYGPACPPPVCPNPAATSYVCCNGSAQRTPNCDADGGVGCDPGFTLYPGYPCPRDAGPSD
ncbi:MAG TPA: hypothetical protein VMI75_16660, partial [Polyangiaceae bacterium]|nr:hypothetical protein [Polyangiaceae bacterium]